MVQGIINMANFILKKTKIEEWFRYFWDREQLKIIFSSTVH